jgi:hypothetical protein
MSCGDEGQHHEIDDGPEAEIPQAAGRRSDGQPSRRRSLGDHDRESGHQVQGADDHEAEPGWR